jgi:hypothetical protein
MLVYLFRQRGNADHALTTDLTGRNLPYRTSASPWVFVKALELAKSDPQVGFANLEDALRQLKAVGYYIFEASG